MMERRGDRKPLDDCFVHDKHRLRHDDALSLLRDRLTPIVGSETVSLSELPGRVLSDPVVAPRDVPLHTNAAVDGFAYLHPAPDRPIEVSTRIAAGELSPAPLEPGTAARIFTGAPMPSGADSVAMQEDCATTRTHVTIPTLKAGANCRKRGEDVQAGDIVLDAGARANAAAIAAIASLGFAEVSAYGRLRVALLSNGAELVVPDSRSTLKPGQVFDSNGPMLSALLGGMPCLVDHLPIVGDTRAAVFDALAEAAATHDVVLTSGGASRGDEDHMLDALDTLGHRHMWQLAVKPGRPMMMGQIARDGASDAYVFGLPGNPVAAMVCFQLYVRPALLRLAGANWLEPPRYFVPSGFDLSAKKPDRREFVRGRLEEGVAHRFGRDGSGLISSLTQSDGLIEIPEEVTSIRKGDPVAFIPWTAFS